MNSKIAWRASARVGQDRRWMSSFLSVANQLSATALSQHCRGRERLWRIAWPASSVVKLRAVYCEPRSAWKSQPR